MLLVAACSGQVEPGSGNSGGQNGGASWTADGGFSSNGGQTGGANGAASGSSSGATPLPTNLDDCGANNAAGITPEQLKALEVGGNVGALRYLYPYDGTVFPRGLKAPLLMWDGGSADAVYVRIKAAFFDYRGCFKPTAEGQLQLRQEIWEMMGSNAKGEADPYTVELTLLKGSAVQGPIRGKISVASATITGSIFYNSYNAGGSSSGPTNGGFPGIPGFPGFPGGGGGGLSGQCVPGQVGAGGISGNGAILRIKPGANEEVFARQGQCTGCHSVSANGTRLMAKELSVAGGNFNTTDGQIYSITPQTAPNPSPSRAASRSAFTGLSPDGSVYIASGGRNNIGPEVNGGTGQVPTIDAAMFETDTGKAVPNTGIPVTALMPTFSPDATLIAFNDYAVKNGHSIVVMGYDSAARKAKSPKTLFTHDTLYPGWPFVLPDNRAVVFALGSSQFFAGDGVGISCTSGPTSDLSLVDIASGTTVLLAQAMGFRTAQDAQGDKTYLPFGKEDLHHVYYPTVTPVASGGYFWVFFDSYRHYGNKGLKRQLWGAALAVSPDGTYAKDPSRPAFYLTGQSLESANHRAFTVLDPCKTDGNSCGAGADCCSGYCLDKECVPSTGTCSQTNDACDASSDCCNPKDQCINHFCSQIILE